MKIRYSYILVLIVVGAFFLTPLMCVSGVVAKESTSLPKSSFLNVERTNIDYDRVYGTEKVTNDSDVSIKIVLTNISKEIEKSTLSFYSELVGAEGHIMEEVLKSGSSYTVEHKKVGEEVAVIWSGKAPEVGKRTTYTLLNVTQKTTEGEYLVVDIKRDVTSKTIEDAIFAMDNAEKVIEKANLIIANATKEGINVNEAKLSLKLANERLNTSLDRYNEGRPGEALKKAKEASDSAKIAEEKASAAIGFTTYKTYIIIVAVVVIAIVAFVFLIGQRRRRRGIY